MKLDKEARAETVTILNRRSAIPLGNSRWYRLRELQWPYPGLVSIASDVASPVVLLGEVVSPVLGEALCIFPEGLDRSLGRRPGTWAGRLLEHPGMRGIGLIPVEVADVR